MPDAGPTLRATVLVRGLRLQAEIGLNADEPGRRQPLIVDVEAQIDGEPWRGISHTLDYDRVVAHALALTSAGHIGLVETLAARLARAILAEPHVVRVMVRVLKPEALAAFADTAGVEIVAERS